MWVEMGSAGYEMFELFGRSDTSGQNFNEDVRR